MRRSWCVLSILVLFACSTPDGPNPPSGEDTETPEVQAVDAPSEPETAASVDTVPEPVVPRTPEVWLSDPSLALRGLHLTWQGDPATTMTAQWGIPVEALDGYVPRVWYVPAEGAEDGGWPFGPGNVVEGYCRSYEESEKGVPEDAPVFAGCVVELTGLRADTAYSYRAGTWAGFDAGSRAFDAPSLGPVATFTTALAKGDRTPFSFIAAGDSRGGYVKMTEASARLADRPDRFWLFNGDMNNDGLQSEWDQWFTAMAPVGQTRPILPVEGNHEKFRQVFYEQFALPVPPWLPELYHEHAWSLDVGNVHVIGLDSYEASVVALKQFLITDLQKASTDPDIDWIVVQCHHSAYSSSTSHGSTARVQLHWVPLFEKYDVDLVFSGHDHIYERTHPIRENLVDEEEGITYVVTGAFFAPGYMNGNDWFTAVSWHGDIGNYVEVEVEGTTMKATAWSGDGQTILDEFTLTK